MGITSTTWVMLAFGGLNIILGLVYSNTTVLVAGAALWVTALARALVERRRYHARMARWLEASNR